MDGPEVIHIIRGLQLYYMNYDGVAPNWRADVYDRGICLKSLYGASKDGVRKEAVAWVYDNFNVPKSIEAMEYRQPEELDNE